MALMYDRMFRETWTMPTAADTSKQMEMSQATRKNILEVLKRSEVIVADNVARYYMASPDKIWRADKDFPNVAPPFPEIWIEYVTAPGDDMDRVGIMVVSNILPDDNNLGGKVKWMMQMYLFLEFQHGIVGPICRALAECSPEGQIVPIGGNDDAWYFSEWFGTNFQKLASEDYGNASAHIMSVMNPALLTFCFLHCKNVDLITNEPSAKLSHAHLKRHKKPLVRFKTLDIRPIREILKREGDVEHTGLKMALHICRGHFKDFSKGKGLFGKYKGMYWWESQVRGSGIEGTVVKNYNVKRP